ncbi:MAG: PIN domain-containing protein [Nanoarchaeota archaeon]|nr:PIN domain-containing protein [Nanoarchaeota archaeon]
MDIVIDANILFAALIRKSITSELLFREGLHLYAPEFLFVEFEKYRELIKKKTERTDAEFDEFFGILERRIALVPYEEIKPFVAKAGRISPDRKDVPYVALALKMNIAIWSNDKPLKNKQKAVKVYSTEEIARI